jgi:uncharacterized protein (DUF433 family)
MDGYTPAQAAAVTGLPLAAVHKAIDSRLIRPRTARSGGTVRRLLTKEQLIFLQLEAEGLRLLPVGTRREIAESIKRSPKTEKLRVANGTALVIEIGSARRRVESHLKQLDRIEGMVVSDPEIMRGTPVFKGTRIPVDLVADMLAQGATAEEILEGYSTLNKEKIGIAPLYMRAFPRRGRPSRRKATEQTSIRSFVVDAMQRKFGDRRRTPVLAPPVPGTGKPGPRCPDRKNPYGL